MTRFTVPYWFDFHVHLRQAPLLAPMIAAHQGMGCFGALAMPNTKPPVAKVHETDDLDYWSIEAYRDQMLAAGGDKFDDFIIPLYLTKDTTPAMIEAGAKSGVLRAAKYYPPHGTTGADFAYPFVEYIKNGVFQALADNNITLCIHGEEHGLKAEAYFGRNSNAEEQFYREQMPRLIDEVPTLRVVSEHLTTAVAADFVANTPDNVAGTITPQHLLHTVGDLLNGFKYHLYCLPLVKYEADRQALRDAILTPGQTKYFAGTDSAPHTVKATDVGCAAGCYTGYIAPQLYAEAFEAAGADLSDTQTQDMFIRFLSTNGPAFYSVAMSDRHFTLEKAPQKIEPTHVPNGDPGEDVVTPLPLGLGRDHVDWRLTPDSE
ncbi:MAG: hypothetical protein AAF213_02480 [Pseudomonadota bacterium]